jgi:hypothetical protein
MMMNAEDSNWAPAKVENWKVRVDNDVPSDEDPAKLSWGYFIFAFVSSQEDANQKQYPLLDRQTQSAH